VCYSLYNAPTLLPDTGRKQRGCILIIGLPFLLLDTQSSTPEDGQNNCPQRVELTGMINKPLLLHLFGCLYYLYQWCTLKQISDNEMCLLIKYIKSVLWRVAKRLFCTEDARCLKVKVVTLNFNTNVCIFPFQFVVLHAHVRKITLFIRVVCFYDSVVCSVLHYFMWKCHHLKLYKASNQSLFRRV